MPDKKECIALALLQRRYIRACEYTVWSRYYRGETIAAIRRDFPKVVGVSMYNPDTLYEWIHKVEQRIKDQRLLWRRDRARQMTGYTTASGSKCRRVGDPTAQGRTPDTETSWDVERLQLEGKLDRWSRKR